MSNHDHDHDAGADRRDGQGQETTPGNPLETEDLTRHGSMNPGRPGDHAADWHAEGSQTSPGNPLEREDLQHHGSMNPGPEEDAEGHIKK